MFIQTTTSCKNSWNYLILGDPTEEVQGVRITDECLFHWSFSNNRMTAGLITIRPATYITIQIFVLSSAVAAFVQKGVDPQFGIVYV